MQSEVLPRSISHADLTTTQRCRESISRDFHSDPPDGGTCYFTSTPSFTLTLPVLTGHNPGFKDFFYHRIIDYNTKDELEGAKCLNYCKDASELNPLFTSGDGNCLLHAASLNMWGFQDRTFILRKAISESVTNCHKNSLKERWYAWRAAELQQMGTVLEPHQWEGEWKQMIRYTTEARNDYGVMEGLDQFHIFVLANVLRRPIIVYAIPKIRSAVSGGTLQQLEFHGLYLPLLWAPNNCKKGPLPIAFRNGHFSALTVIDHPDQYKHGFLLFPLFDNDGYDLPVRFLKHQTEQPWDCRRAYLDLAEVRHGGRQVQCAKLAILETPAYLKPLLDGFVAKCNQAYHSQGIRQSALDQPVFPPCKSGCGRLGDPSYNGYCFICYQARQKDNLHQNVPTTSSLKCSNNCNNPGRPEFLGMCQSCYRQQQQPRGQGQPPPPALGGNPHEGISRQCPTPGCDFYGSLETNFYCSSCFKKNMTHIYEQNEPRAGRRQSYPNASPPPLYLHRQQELVVGATSGGQKCPECWQSLGVPEYGGICRQCYTSKANPGQKCTQCREFFGAPEYGGLCNQCFMKRTEKAPSDKCNVCHDFHASPEYGGLCHGCFMKKTISDKGHGLNRLDSPPRDQMQHFSDIGYKPKISRSSSVQGGYSASDGKFIHSSTAPQGQFGFMREMAHGRACIACDVTLSLDVSPLTVCRKHAQWMRNTLSMLREDIVPPQMSTNPPVPIGTEPANADAYGKLNGLEQPSYEPMLKRTHEPLAPTQYAAQDLTHYQSSSSSADRRPLAPSSSSAVGYSAATGSSAEPKPAKKLCSIVGCAYLAEPHLNGLCENCYDEHYGKKNHQALSPYSFS